MRKLDVACCTTRAARIAICITVILLAIAVTANSLNAALTNHWKFNETSGTTADDSAGSLDLTLHSLTGDTTNKFEAGGKFGNALRFDFDTGDHAYNESVPFLMDTDHTFAMWVKHSSLPGSGAPQRYIGWGWSDTRTFFGANATTGIQSYGVSSAGATFAANSAPPLNEWVHYAVVRSATNGTLSLYRDGALLEARTLAASGQINPMGWLRIGKSRDTVTPPGFFDGLMDDLAIWNEPLTAQQVLAVKNMGAEHYNDIVVPTTITWQVDNAGNWNTSGNWDSQTVPNGNDKTVVFGSAITAPRTIFSDEAVTVKSVQFNNANTYVVAGVGGVSLASNAGNASIQVNQGSHQFQTQVNLSAPTNVQVANGAALDFNNRLTLNGNNLNIATTGSGQVNINHSVVAGGGTISNSGTLGTAGATSIKGNLTSTGTLHFNLGGNSTNEFDSFSITGNATLSGLIDVEAAPTFSLTGPLTVLTATSLNAAGLALHPSDTSAFSLSTVGNNLVLSALGGLQGDYNSDGKVDAADYVAWRNDPAAHGGTPNGYLAWRANFGATSGGAAATGLANGGSLAAVPEPTAAHLAVIVLGSMRFVRGGWGFRTRFGRQFAKSNCRTR